MCCFLLVGVVASCGEDGCAGCDQEYDGDRVGGDGGAGLRDAAGLLGRLFGGLADGGHVVREVLAGVAVGVDGDGGHVVGVHELVVGVGLGLGHVDLDLHVGGLALGLVGELELEGVVIAVDGAEVLVGVHVGGQGHVGDLLGVVADGHVRVSGLDGAVGLDGRGHDAGLRVVGDARRADGGPVGVGFGCGCGAGG